MANQPQRRLCRKLQLHQCDWVKKKNVFKTETADTAFGEASAAAVMAFSFEFAMGKRRYFLRCHFYELHKQVSKCQARLRSSCKVSCALD